jgi:hypothetical protein
LRSAAQQLRGKIECFVENIGVTHSKSTTYEVGSRIAYDLPTSNISDRN